jgi:hypothetical protein
MYIDDNEVIDLDSDTPPSSGTWLDAEGDVLALLTEEEAEAGERLHELIDPDDDDDNGLQHIGGPER